MIRKPAVWLLGAIAGLAACDSTSAREAQIQHSRPGVVVDSAFTPEEQLRRFQVELPRVAALVGGATERDVLVRRYVRALETHDTSAIREMTLSRAEFAYLYYPSSRYTRPPTRQDPGLVWFQMQQNSEKGIVRALRRYGGQPLGYRSYRCDPVPEGEGENQLWTGCVVVATFGEADTSAYRLFGTIVERGGRFKFVSYANRL